MKETAIRKAAFHFGLVEPVSLTALSSGLIHQTYRVWNEQNAQGIVLQQLNSAVFKEPQKIIENYCVVFNHLQQTELLSIPEPLRTTAGEWLWRDAEGLNWRANAYVAESYTECLPITTEKARKAANSFAQLTQALASLESRTLAEVIPGFHNLAMRFDQFKNALESGVTERIALAHQPIEQLLKRNHYADFFSRMCADQNFKKRIMHHDCKLSNILFHQQTGDAICPIDLDTLMPGYYFSDLGDMIRSMAPSADETEKDVDKIFIRSDVYKALLEGYLAGLENVLTPTEKKYIHHSGLLMIYMQALRFLTDYLTGDMYYKTTYDTQNYDRALNQLTLLKRLEEFLLQTYHYTHQS